MKQHETSSRVEQLATRLSSVQVAKLATGLPVDPQATAVWHEFPDGGLYVAVIEDRRRPEAVRFAAALTLRRQGPEQFRRADPRAMAQVFAAALQHDLAGYAYPWGWLWANGDPVGMLGAVFVEIGAPAVEPLAALLDDATARDAYLGSEEATEMAMRQYRVKDFAAFYLATILHIDLPWEHDLARRDQAIGALRKQLPAASPPPS